MTGVLIRKEERGSLVSWSPCIPQYAVFLFSTNKLSTNKIFPTSKKKKKKKKRRDTETLGENVMMTMKAEIGVMTCLQAKD
jgi:hypothetical protein